MPPPRPKICRWTLLPVFFAIGLIALASCKGEEPAANSKTRSRFRNSTVSVRVVPVREGRLTYTIYATGTAVPDQEINLSARIEGQVTQLDVREGDWVKAGQVLVVQDDAILRHQYQLSVAEVRAARARLDKMIAGNRPEEIAQAEAQVAQAKALADRVRAEVESSRAKKKEARTNASMYERMFRQGIVSPQRRLASKTLAESLTAEHAEMEAKLKESEAALQASRAKFRLMKAGSRKEDIAAARSELLRAQENANLLRVRMQHARTLSPIEAIVSTRHVEPGDLARVGTRLITLVNTERLKIRTQISELDLPKVRLGQSVQVTFDAYRKKRFSGRILRIFPTVDPTSRQATIEVGMKNPDGAIPSGLLARLTFTSTADGKGLIVPKAALVRRVQGGKYEVFVAKKAAGKPGIRREGGLVARNGAAAAETGRTPGVRIQTGTNGGPPASGAREGVRPAVAGPNGQPEKRTGKRGYEPAHIAESRKITAGEIEGDLAEVRSGLRPGDLVVVKGQHRLRPGSSIRIVQ